MYQLKIAFGYNPFSKRSIEYHEGIVRQARQLGYDVYSVAVSPKSESPALSFAELDKKVLSADKEICRFRDKIIEQIAPADVFWLFNGANFHPSWIKLLPQQQLKIYGCHDDPESSQNLSLPVAPYFDTVITGNISVLPFYRGHTGREARWLPLFQTLEPARLSESDISKKNRSIDVVFLGERESVWRRRRFDYLQQIFPEGFFRGRGWKNGWIENSVDIYLQSKIGINIHNSVGPVNMRVYELASHGVMQICDNRCRLGHIFKLSKEVVGYDYLDEAIDYINYYLDPTHEEERCQIAWNGYQRYLSEYTTEKIWDKAISIIHAWYSEKESGLLIPKKFEITNSYYGNTAYNIKKYLKNFYIASKNITKKFLHHHHDDPEGIITTPIALSLNEAKDRADLHLLKKIPKFKKIDSSEVTALSCVATKLIGSSKTILEIDPLNLEFAIEVAQDPTRKITILSQELKCINKEKNLADNIEYKCCAISDLEDAYDIVVCLNSFYPCIDVSSLVANISKHAPKAIISIPDNDGVLLEKQFYHTFYKYYKNVYLFSMPDIYLPEIIPCKENTGSTARIVALCEN